jgi:hypothetical protein
MLMRGMYIVGSLEYSLTDLLLSKDISILIYLKIKQTSDYRVWGTYFKDGKIIKKNESSVFLESYCNIYCKCYLATALMVALIPKSQLFSKITV